VDLEAATVAKFEEVSARHGYTVRLTDDPREAANELVRTRQRLYWWEEAFLGALLALRVTADLSADAVAQHSGMSAAEVVSAERRQCRPDSNKLARMRDVVLGEVAYLAKRVRK
jgi:hypothetical protein